LISIEYDIAVIGFIKYGDIALLRDMKYKKTCHSCECGNPESLCTSSR